MVEACKDSRVENGVHDRIFVLFKILIFILLAIYGPNFINFITGYYIFLFQVERYTNGDMCGFKKAKNTAKTSKTIPKLFVTYHRKPLATVL